MTERKLGVYGGNVKVSDLTYADSTGQELTEMVVTGPGVILDKEDTEQRDLYGEYFTKSTYFGRKKGDGVDAMFHHGHPLLSGSGGGAQYIVPQKLYDFFRGLANHQFTHPVKTALDEDAGILAATLILNMRNEYEKWVGEQARKGLLSWSSGSAWHMADIDHNTGRIKRWPIVEFSLTPTPAEPRTYVEPAEHKSVCKFLQLEPVRNVSRETCDQSELYYQLGRQKAILNRYLNLSL